MTHTNVVIIEPPPLTEIHNLLETLNLLVPLQLTHILSNTSGLTKPLLGKPHSKPTQSGSPLRRLSHVLNMSLIIRLSVTTAAKLATM